MGIDFKNNVSSRNFTSGKVIVEGLRALSHDHAMGLIPASGLAAEG